MGSWTGAAGKRVVITGATNGIGLAAAEELAIRGAILTIVARDASKATALANRIGADVVLADLASQSAIAHAADEILARHARIDVLVNNAGVYLTSRQLTSDGIENDIGPASSRRLPPATSTLREGCGTSVASRQT